MKLKTALVFPAALCLATAGSVRAGEPPAPYEPAPSPAPMEPVSDSGWQFTLALYGWFAGVEGNLDVGALSADFDSSFSDIWDNLDLGIMAAGAARYGRFALYGDINYLELSNDTSFQGRTDPGFNHVEVEIEQFVGNLIGTYRVIDEPGGFLELGGGLRYADFDIDLKFTDRHTGPGPGLQPLEISGGDDLFDGVAALRAGVTFGEGWFLSAYGDVGGGDSDLTWMVGGSIGYWFTESFSVGVGYRHLAYEFEGHGDDELDLEFSGPVAGIGIRF